MKRNTRFFISAAVLFICEALLSSLSDAQQEKQVSFEQREQVAPAQIKDQLQNLRQRIQAEKLTFTV